MTVPLLDAGVWLASMDPADPFHEDSARLIETQARDGVATLDLALYEVTNVAVRRWRDRESAAALVSLVLAAVGDLLVRVDEPLVRAAIALGVDEGLTTYDAAYLACARLNGWQLVSTDLRDLVGPGLACSPGDAAAADP